MAEYGYKELAEILDVSERTARRYVKEAGVEGTVSYRSEGGTKRVFSEVDVERLKAWQTASVIPPPRPAVPEGGMTRYDKTEPFPVLAMWENIGHALTELPPLQAQMEEVITRLDTIQAVRQQEQAALTEALEKLCEELTATREEARQREEVARQREEALTAHLTALQEQAQRREESARRREAELTARWEALQEELRRPWWKRLWPPGEKMR
jgi:hypothetical protein